jgi:hypothetical protein
VVATTRSSPIVHLSSPAAALSSAQLRTAGWLLRLSLRRCDAALRTAVLVEESHVPGAEVADRGAVLGVKRDASSGARGAATAAATRRCARRASSTKAAANGCQAAPRAAVGRLDATG